MLENKDEFKVPSISAIKKLLDPIIVRLENIDSKVQVRDKTDVLRYYRNEDLKRLFGLSSNTIIKYRETGILPYTKLGDIYLYDSTKLDQILKNNQV